MRQFEEGDIVIRQGEIFFLKVLDKDHSDITRATKLSVGKPEIREISDDMVFITNLSYLKRSSDSGQVKKAKQIIQDKGHDVQYIADGLYAIDRDTSKALYATSANLLGMAESLVRVAREKQEKQKAKKEKPVDIPKKRRSRKVGK